MQIDQRTTVLGIFPTRGQAQGAIHNLWHAGFDKEQIGSVMPGGKVVEASAATESQEERAADGAVGGALAGGTAGAVAGATAAALLPGIGPLLAGGILAGLATGAAAGAALGAFAGPFLALGFSEEEIRTFERDVQAGSTIVAVRGSGREEEAAMILRSHGGKVITRAPAAAAYEPTGPRQ
jgi:hypothetical protein